MATFLKFALIIFLMFGGGISVFSLIFYLFYFPINLLLAHIPGIRRVSEIIAGIISILISGLIIYLLYLLIRPWF